MRETIDRIRAALSGVRPSCKLGLVLSGGGARAAYQAGVLQYIADQVDGAGIDIVTGVSAGSLNAAFIANDASGFRSSVSNLASCWQNLKSEDARFETDDRNNKQFVSMGSVSDVQTLPRVSFSIPPDSLKDTGFEVEERANPSPSTNMKSILRDICNIYDMGHS